MSNEEFNAMVSFTITEGENRGEGYHIQSEVKGQTGYIVLGLVDVLADVLADYSPKDADNLLLDFLVRVKVLTEEVRKENEANSTN